MSTFQHSTRLAQEAEDASKVIFILVSELNWAIHHLEERIESGEESPTDSTLLMAMTLLSDFAHTAASSYTAAARGLMLEHIRKPRDRAEKAQAIRPGLDRTKASIEGELGPMLMHFVSGLPGVDLDIIQNGKAPRLQPPR